MTPRPAAPSVPSSAAGGRAGGVQMKVSKRVLKASLVAGAMAACVPATASAAGGLAIDVVSTRADLVSAGDALVSIRLPEGTDPRNVRVTDDGRDITKAFAVRKNRGFEGLVTGLSVGRNVIAATVLQPVRETVKLTLVNHPNGGPVLSGPPV